MFDEDILYTIQFFYYKKNISEICEIISASSFSIFFWISSPVNIKRNIHSGMVEFVAVVYSIPLQHVSRFV